MVEDLQHVPVDEFWDRFKSVMGPDGLVTYRYLGSRSTVGSDGTVEGAMVIRRDMRNPAGGLELAVSAAGTDALQIDDWSVMFVARGTVGPFVTTGDVVHGDVGRLACRTTLRDEGNGDRVIASALAVFRRSS